VAKGVKWSPDGTCLLTATSCDVRLLELWSPPAQENELLVYDEDGVYDFAWYPRQHSRDPVSCVFATASRDQPVHLWDASNTGATLRASYVARTDYDDLHGAISVAMSNDKIYAGADGRVFVFHLAVPGSDVEVFTKGRRDDDGKKNRPRRSSRRRRC